MLKQRDHPVSYPHPKPSCEHRILVSRAVLILQAIAYGQHPGLALIVLGDLTRKGVYTSLFGTFFRYPPPLLNSIAALPIIMYNSGNTGR